VIHETSGLARRFLSRLIGRPSRTAWLASAALGLHAALLAYGAAVHSPGWDEVGHLPAGISHWRSGRFDAYRVNPPLVRLVASLPAVLSGVDIDWTLYSSAPWQRQEFVLGDELIARLGSESLWYFRVSRWACIPFSLLGGLVCFWWSRDRFGTSAGLGALALWCFSPTIVANAQMITPDTGAAALGVAACYSFWGWLRDPSGKGAVAAGCLLGLALLTKFTWVMLPLLWAAIWLIRPPKALVPGRQRAWGREALHLGVIFLFALQVVGLGYGFERCFKPLGTIPFTSRTLADFGAYDPTPVANRFQGTWLGRLPVPLPANYLEGIDVQKVDFERGSWSYLGGEWKRGGWWYYYLYCLLTKEPLGTWALGGLAVGMVFLARTGNRPGFADIVLLAPPSAVLILVSSQTGFNHHLRYVLPALPFVYIGISRIFVTGGAGPRGRLVRLLAWGLLAWSVGACLWHTPHHLSYFNELVGGPRNGPLHLHNSNLDWGQDLLFLKRWAGDHPEARPLQVVFLSCYSAESLGIWDDQTFHASDPDACLGREPRLYMKSPRYYAISVGRMAERIPPNRPDPFSRFRTRVPDDRVGHTFLIYKISD